MGVNEALFEFVNHGLQNPVLDAVMPYLTQFGDFIFIFLVVVALFLYAKITHRDTLKKVAIITLISLLVAGGIAVFLKHMVHEPRPFMSLDNVHLLMMEDDPDSFPSGHTTAVFAVVCSLILNMKSLSKKYYKAIDILLVIFALLIPFSRMYVGLHYPGDVLVGAVIGILSAFLINRYKDEILSIIKF